MDFSSANSGCTGSLCFDLLTASNECGYVHPIGDVNFWTWMGLSRANPNEQTWNWEDGTVQNNLPWNKDSTRDMGSQRVSDGNCGLAARVSYVQSNWDTAGFREADCNTVASAICSKKLWNGSRVWLWLGRTDELIPDRILKYWVGGAFIYSGFHFVITSSFSKELVWNFYSTCPRIKNIVSEKIVKIWRGNNQLCPIARRQQFLIFAVGKIPSEISKLLKFDRR